MENTPIKCEYCGKVRKQETIGTIGGNKVTIPKPCNCKEATAARERFEREEREREAREAVERHQNQLKKAGIMPFWWNKCQPDHSYDQILQTGMGLYIDGEIGTGKTHIAINIAMACLESKWTVEFTSMRDITRRLRATWGERGIDEVSVFDSLMRKRVLIIDDFGKEVMTETLLRDLFDLIDKRKDLMLPVIITTNYSKPELIVRMAHGLDDTTTAEAIVSRLREITKRVHVDGEDRRLQ